MIGLNLSLWSAALGKGGVPAETVLPGTLLDDFEVLADWTLGGTAGGSRVADTVSKRSGNQSVKVTSVAGNATIIKVTNFTVTADGVVLFWVDINDPNLVDSINIRLGADGTNTKYWTGFVTVNGELDRGRQLMAVALSDLTAVGGITTADPIVRVRLQVTSTPGGGAASFDSLYYNRKLSKPKIVIGFDDNWISQYTEAFAYMLPRGVPGTIYCIQDRVGNANYMSLAQLQEVYAAGWDIGNHTKDHIGVNDYDRVAICQSQTPSGALTINGTMASGGVATFDTPRLVVFWTGTGSYAKYCDITGTLAGQPQTERVYLRNSGWVPSTKTFDTVSSIVMSAAPTGALTVGVSRSQAEILAALTAQRDYLIANGMPRAALHVAYPLGQTNVLADAALASMSAKTARTVTGQTIATALGLYDPLRVPALTPSNTTTLAAVKTFIDQAIARGCSAHLCFHELVTSPVNGTQFPIANFQAVIDYLITKRDAGLIDMTTVSRWFDGIRAYP